MADSKRRAAQRAGKLGRKTADYLAGGGQSRYARKFKQRPLERHDEKGREIRTPRPCLGD